MKMKLIKSAFPIFLLFLSVSAFAQQAGSVTGTLQDAQTKEPMAGAMVEIFPVSDSAARRYVTANAQGRFSVTGLPYREYAYNVTFLGYDTLAGSVKVNRAAVALGVLQMAQKAQDLDEVLVSARAMRTSSKGDTVVYNSGAFKVTQDAATEDLLKKMPGISVQNGTVTAHGETVQKILVDGKEFFGSDVTTAIKNLPAEAIDKVEVFNKLSDQAEFSGVDDGEGYKAINLVTRKNMNRGTFGKFYAGYGFNDKYNAGASLNLFNDKRRFSIIGMANNVNQQNFAIDDILGVVGTSNSGGGGARHRSGREMSNFMVGNQSGVSTVYSLGVNYSEEWSEKVKFDGSYFFNSTKTHVNTVTNRNYYLGDDSTQYYDALGIRDTRNYNHRFNARLDYKINENNSLMFRPSVSLQTNDASSSDTSTTMLSANAMENALVNLFRSTTSSHTEGYNISGNLIYRHKFGEKLGRTLTVMFGGGVSKNDGKQDQYSLTRYFNPDSESLLDQYIANNSRSYRLSGHVMYSEPLSEKSQLLFSYNANYSYSDRDKRSYQRPEYIMIDSLSNTYNSGYLTQQVGPGFRYNNKKVMVIGNLSYQYSTLAGDQQFPKVTKTSADFNNLVYMALLDVKFNPTNTLRAMLRSSTNNPSVTQLQDVLDVSNPLFVSQGNPNLRPVYANRMFVRYVNTNVTKGRTFMAMLGGSMQSNYISNATVIAGKNGYEVKDPAGNTVIVLNQGAQYSRPVNMNGYWNVNGMMSYGLPVSFLKSNLNVNLGINYAATPNIFNEVKSTTNTTTYTAGAVLGSNISEKLDFTLGYDVGYNVASNKVRKESNNRYVNQQVSGNFKWITWAGITLQANGSYLKYSGITDSFVEDYFLLNASIGKKIFKHQRGEINVSAYDLLNQNKSFSRNVTATYIENVKTNVLGRYFSINLIYNLRRFGGKNVDASSTRRGKTPDSLHDGRPPMGRPPMGPPPGGHRGPM